MFKKRKKMDPRVRYQHADFTKKLNQARRYRRVAQPRPESNFLAYLGRLGLGTPRRQITLIVILLALAYIIFLPNPLSVKTIKINGLSGTEAEVQARGYVNAYLAAAPFYSAQHNIIFLHAGAVADYLKSNDPQILRVTATKKHLFSRTLEVDVVAKQALYQVKRNADTLIVYNDGTVQSHVSETPTAPVEPASASVPAAAPKPAPVPATTPPNLITVNINDATEVYDGQKYFSDKLIGGLESIFNVLPGRVKQDFDRFELNAATQAGPTAGTLPLDIPDATVYLRKNLPTLKGKVQTFKVYIDLSGDIQDSSAKLALLLAEMPPDRYKNLAYIDMRFVERGFICLVNAPCASDSSVQQPPAPQTPSAAPAANSNTNSTPPTNSNASPKPN